MLSIFLKCQLPPKLWAKKLYNLNPTELFLIRENQWL
jgi:hypothetical protein